VQNRIDLLGVYRSPAEYVDSDHPLVVAAAKRLTARAAPAEAAIQIFNFVRDLRYGAPDFEDLSSFRASETLARGGGYCVPKACAFTALARAAGLAARLAFADVTNHLASTRTLELMGGRTFAWHGYAQIWIDRRWVSVSPTFDTELCARRGAPPLAFDGVHDAHLQAVDHTGRAFMRYLRRHGAFHDVPARFLAQEMPRRHPRMCAAIRAGEVS
jgi:transglutaminase-like putative cysteine protease